MQPRKNILLVDDNALTLLTLTRILQQHGYSVRGASNPNTALELVAAGDIELVIMDYNLPDNGIQLGPTLKRYHPSLPLVVFSGDPAAGEASSYADLLLPKPQEPEKLLQHIRQLLEGSSRNAA